MDRILRHNHIFELYPLKKAINLSMEIKKQDIWSQMKLRCACP